MNMIAIIMVATETTTTTTTTTSTITTNKNNNDPLQSLFSAALTQPSLLKPWQAVPLPAVPMVIPAVPLAPAASAAATMVLHQDVSTSALSFQPSLGSSSGGCTLFNDLGVLWKFNHVIVLLANLSVCQAARHSCWMGVPFVSLPFGCPIRSEV